MFVFLFSSFLFFFLFFFFLFVFFFFSSRRRHTRSLCDWSSDVCSSDLYHWRGPLFVSLAILSFAVAIRPLGLIVAALASFLIAALGTSETRWGETLIVGRSEERRVGKECRARWWRNRRKKNKYSNGSGV